MSFRPCPASIQQQDERYCPRCKLRWDIAEDKPDCPEGDLPGDMPEAGEIEDQIAAERAQGQEA